MRVVINAGHTLSGPAHGTIAIKNESLETRNIVKKCKLLFNTNDTVEVEDSTLDTVFSEEEYINKISDMANKLDIDLFISVEFSHSCNHLSSGSTIYINDSGVIPEAMSLYKYLTLDGFSASIENGSNIFTFMNKIKTPKIIILKVCFIDSVNDMKLYNPDRIANAIYNAIIQTVPVNGWYYENATDCMKYYQDSTVCTGVQCIERNYYYFDDSGVLQCGLIPISDGKFLYSSIDGKLYTDQWVFYRRGIFYINENHEISYPSSADDVITITVDEVTYTFTQEGCVEYTRSLNGDLAMSMFIGSDGNRYPYIDGTEIVINDYKLPIE